MSGTFCFLISLLPLDGFAVSALVLLGAIIALFAAMRRSLKKK